MANARSFIGTISIANVVTAAVFEPIVNPTIDLKLYWLLKGMSNQLFSTWLFDFVITASLMGGLLIYFPVTVQYYPTNQLKLLLYITWFQ